MLLLLDINGLLCRKMPKNSQSHIKLNSYDVDIRPGCHDFLNFCYDN